MDYSLDIFSKVSDSVLIFNPITKEKYYYNTASYKNLGYSYEEFKHLDLTKIMSQSALSIADEYIDAVLNGEEKSLYTEHIKKDGNLQYAFIKLLPFDIKNDRLIFSIWKDMTLEHLVEKEQKEKNIRLYSFLDVLDKLISSDAFKIGDTHDYFWNVVKLISETLDIDRVSIRLYNQNHTELKSYAMYDKIKKRQINGKTLQKKDYPLFFHFIEKQNIVKIDDIMASEELKNMIQVFFSQDGMIHSLLASKIMIRDQVGGYIFFQSRKKINWSHDDISFANQIASNISTMIVNSKLIKQNNELETIVEKRTIELTKQIEIAKKANNAKSLFLSNMSHEIRTPLNAILGFLSLINRDEIKPEHTHYFDRINYAARHLYDIITDVLDMSKIESGKLNFHQKWVRIDDIFNETILLFQDELKRKNVQLISQMMVKHDMFFLDEMRIKQVYNNIIGNAVKFTDHGFVKAIMEETVIDNEHSFLVLTVEDSGIGIAENNREKLFKPFEQLDQSGTNAYQGTGLGLAITNELVKSMNGHISYESQLGVGTTFYVKIEVKYQVQANDVQKINVTNEQQLKLDRGSLLIVDDNQINQEYVKDTFEKHMHTIDLASNGFEALAKTEENTYDYIIMDIHMPVINGYLTSHLIRLNAKNQRTKIIVLSADALDERINHYGKYGIDNYLIKPLPSKRLIEECMNTKRHNAFQNQPRYAVDMNEIFLNEIGFDYESAMTYMGNKTSLYIKLLKQFIINHQHDMDALSDYIEHHDTQNAKNIVHNLKGVLTTLGLKTLASKIIEFENRLLISGIDNMLHEQLIKLKKAYKEMIFILEYVLRYIKED